MFFPILIYSQDLILLRNGEELNCRIVKVDSTIIYYDFYKADRKLSSYISKNDIQSYKINIANDIQNDSIASPDLQEKFVVIDTTKFIKEINKWVNLITYSQSYGIHAKGWSIRYYGYNIKNTSNWSIPITIGIDIFGIKPDYFSQSNYQSANMSFLLAGISPFYKLNDYFFVKLGINLIIGDEKLIDFYGREKSNNFYGISPTQGIYYVPNSKYGITFGLSIYEKILSSEVYKNDLGIKLEFGVKF